MPGLTNLGKKRVFDWTFRSESNTPPTDFYLMIATTSGTPGPETQYFYDLQEIAAGNGYTAGGYKLDKNNTDFDYCVQDDINNQAIMQIKDIVVTASGGPIPSTGDPGIYAVLATDNATIANREVVAYWELSEEINLASGQTKTLQNFEIRLKDFSS